jgi:enolase
LPLYEYLRRQAKTTEDYVLPIPFFNVLNGGKHSGNTMAFQEFMIAPVGADSMAQAVQMGSEVYQALKGVITSKFGAAGAYPPVRFHLRVTNLLLPATGIGDEGGFAPPIFHPAEALDLLTAAVKSAGHEGKVKFAIDSAASEFFRSDRYDIGFKAQESHLLSAAELQDLYLMLLDQYPIILLEDPFAEDDWTAWHYFNNVCNAELVGDDLLATNIGRLEIAKRHGACNSMLLKVNQIGTVTEAFAA